MAAQGAIEPAEEDTSTAIAAILTSARSPSPSPSVDILRYDPAGRRHGLARRRQHRARIPVTGALFGDEAGRWTVLAKLLVPLHRSAVRYAVYWSSRGLAPDVPTRPTSLAEVSQIHPFTMAIVLATTASSLPASAHQLLSNPPLVLPARIRRRRSSHHLRDLTVSLRASRRRHPSAKSSIAILTLAGPGPGLPARSHSAPASNRHNQPRPPHKRRSRPSWPVVVAPSYNLQNRPGPAQGPQTVPKKK